MNFLESLAKQFAGKPIDWDELEEALIRADLGVPMTMRIIKTLQEREAWALLGIGDVIKAVREEIARILPRDPAPIRRSDRQTDCDFDCRREWNRQNNIDSETRALNLHEHAWRHYASMLAAADTFRAAAIEQLDIWAKRLGVEIVRGQHGADPAALCYEAYQAAAKQEIDFLLCDTAGRQHTKANLMAELQKIKRTLGKTRCGHTARDVARRRCEHRQ